MRTKRIRIAVVINEAGCWNSSGWGDAETSVPDEDKSSIAFDGMDAWDGTGAERLVWVEVEIPIPQPITVEGTVRDDS